MLLSPNWVLPGMLIEEDIVDEREFDSKSEEKSRRLKNHRRRVACLLLLLKADAVAREGKLRYGVTDGTPKPPKTSSAESH